MASEKITSPIRTGVATTNTAVCKGYCTYAIINGVLFLQLSDVQPIVSTSHDAESLAFFTGLPTNYSGVFGLVKMGTNAAMKRFTLYNGRIRLHYDYVTANEGTFMGNAMMTS